MSEKDLFITGMPRSGTSYLCTILNKIKNAVVINEPAEIFQILHHGSSVSLTYYYEVIRTRIKKGLPISNKISNGTFIEDTAVLDVRSAYIPKVSTGDFLLGTKNTLVYLNTIEPLLAEFPDSLFIACVRHPYDAIASWRKSPFMHIKNADPRHLLNYVDEITAGEIRGILEIRELSLRYAAWWNYLAEIIHRYRSRLMIIRYEDMVSNPDKIIADICRTVSLPIVLTEPIHKSAPRHHHNSLDKSTLKAINEICGESSALLGYAIP